jgi:3-hydroxymyristoyl/3-hydroxydecanoyl-(acyl carrier protein) dehydratase
MTFGCRPPITEGLCSLVQPTRIFTLRNRPTQRKTCSNRARATGDVKFRGHITPDVRRVGYEVDMRQVRRGRLALGIADGRVLADDICVYVARDMSVGLIAAAI